MIQLTVHHSTDTGHRIPGHEGGDGKCARLHGHTYGYTIGLLGNVLDANGFLVDFSVVKKMIDEWDHRLLLADSDPLVGKLAGEPGVILVPFIPTAENMASALADRLVLLPAVESVTVELRETAKTVATVTR